MHERTHIMASGTKTWSTSTQTAVEGVSVRTVYKTRKELRLEKSHKTTILCHGHSPWTGTIGVHKQSISLNVSAVAHKSRLACAFTHLIFKNRSSLLRLILSKSIIELIVLVIGLDLWTYWINLDSNHPYSTSLYDHIYMCVN